MPSVCKSVWTLNVLKSVYWVIYILRFTTSKAHEDRLVKQTSNFINNLILWLAYTVPLGLWVLKAHLRLQKRIFSFRSSFPGDKQLPFALTVSLLMTSLTIHNVDSWILSPLPCRIHSCWIFSVLYWHKTLVEVEKKSCLFLFSAHTHQGRSAAEGCVYQTIDFQGFYFANIPAPVQHPWKLSILNNGWN